MEYTLDDIIKLITEIGFIRNSFYDLNSNFTSKDYNKGYIGAYEYDANLIHLYDSKISLYFYSDISMSIKLSFQRLAFNKAVTQLFISFYTELRKHKIEKIIK